MLPFGLSVGYLAAHLALYCLVLRHRPAFSREIGIFLYHLMSAAGTALVLLLGVVLGPPGALDLATAVGIVALHGIYSLSFLELWSLSEGGYSLAIMAHVDRARSRGRLVSLEAVHRIGWSKQANRLDGVERLGLIRRERGHVALTPLGRVVAWGLALIAWAANIRVRG